MNNSCLLRYGAAVLLFVLVASGPAWAQTAFCFNDGLGADWDAVIDNETGIVTGSHSILGGDITGGRSLENPPNRHFSFTAINPTLSDGPGCRGGNELIDWATVNGTVTGSTAPYGFVGTFLNSCGTEVPDVEGTITLGACPDVLPSKTEAGSPYAAGIDNSEALDAAASVATAFEVTALPNPARAEVHLHYTLDDASDVRLSVYDVLGREVAVLADGPLEAGTHRATFDARGLAAGTYLWRLTVGDEVQTGRMTLLR